MFYAPEGLENLAQGFNPGKHPIKRFALKGREMAWTKCPSNAQKMDWAFLRQKIQSPTGTKLNDGGPHRNMFFVSVTYNNDLAPFQGASAGVGGSQG